MPNVTTIRFNDEYTLNVIDRAAALLNQTRTGFLLSVARERAEAVIKERAQTQKEIETLILSARASLDIAQTLNNPPPPNQALVESMNNYKNTEILHMD
jgi:uncharacterized protein (DUF1778 family)